MRRPARSVPRGLGVGLAAFAVAGAAACGESRVPGGLQPPSAAGRYAVASGASQVTLHGCPPHSSDSPSSLFEGGFIVAEAQCARVDVYAGTNGHPIERRIAFGVPASTCRPTA